MLNIISTIIFAVYFLKLLDFIYLFQIKEYRFDRFLSMFSDESIFNIFYLRNPKLPAKSLRNILIAIIAIPLIFFNLSLIFSVNLLFLIIYFLVSPFFSLSTVILGVFLTGFLARIKRQQLIERAREKVEESSAVFIGITGSYGKSTTKEFLYQILSTKYKVAKTDANQNTDVGVAISILNNLKKDTEFFIVEMGAYKKGEIKTICDFVKPKYGIITALGSQHLELFGSKKNLIEAKTELVNCLPKNGKAYVNSDFKKYKIFSSAEIYWFPVGKKIVNIPTTLSKEYLLNILPCIALALDLKVSEESIIETIKNLAPLQAKLSIHDSINGATVLNDSYNSSYEGFLLAIKTAAAKKIQKKIILSRGLIELGDEKTKIYKSLIWELKKKNIYLYTTDRLFKKLSAKNNLVLYFRNEWIMFRKLRKITDKETLLIIEGKFPEKFIKNLIV